MILLGLANITLILSFALICARLANGSFPNPRTLWPQIRKDRTALFLLIALVGGGIVDIVQIHYDDLLTRALALDFTPHIERIEKGVVVTLQSYFDHPIIVGILSFAYIISFPGLLVGMILATATAPGPDRTRLAHALLAYALNYALVLPFYFLFPVNEPWSFPGSGVRPLLEETLGPAFMESIRPFSGINNCFPSYHVSLSVTLALVALETRTPVGTFAAINAILIAASTVVLGFHWVVDVIAGILFGVFAYYLTRRLFPFPKSDTAFPDSPSR